VHSAMPSFQKYDLYRVAFIAIELFSELVEKSELLSATYSFKDRNKKFLKEFDQERADKVRRAIDEAKKKSKKIEHTGTLLPVVDEDDWNLFTTSCPVCESESMLCGYTDVLSEGAEDWGDVTLEFFADSLECYECGLKLLDIKELELAGMASMYDRSDDFDKWLEENYQSNW